MADDATFDRGRHGALVRKFDALLDMSADELGTLTALPETQRDYAVGETLFSERSTYRHAVIVESGWAISYKLLDDGRRQVLRFILPGDFVGLYTAVIEVANAYVEPVTPLSVSLFPASKIADVFAETPRLGAAIAWSAGREEAILSEHLVSVGRRSALERLAHLFLEFLRRLQLIDLAGERTFRLPVTQEILADALGLSVVHVSRTLRRLREDKLVRLARGHLEILDIRGLQEIADFDDDYLLQDELPDRLQSRFRY